jgi:hypothetical protein
VDGVHSEAVYQLKSSHDKDIKESLKQITDGDIVSHEQLFSRLGTK